MSPPFMSRRGGRGGRPRGPPAFIVQLLRAPLTINNIVALVVTKSVQHHRRLLAFETSAAIPSPVGLPDGKPHHPHHPHHPKPHHHLPCSFKRADHLFGLLSLLFIISIAHNIFTVIRMHRIRKSVFGESMCAARRRWRRGEMSEEEKQGWGGKMKEMGKKMPSVVIASADVVLAVAFFGAWMLTILLGSKEGKVELGVGYASVGALVAFVFNFMVGVNGLKMWVRSKREQKEAVVVVEEADKFVDEKVQLIEN